jgi:pimeloyl-ACP methyl ester carboxylesterase
MHGTAIEASTASGTIRGWVRTGTGAGRALLLHGGPGLDHDYMDGLDDDIGTRWTVASFQQRGLAPSTEDGPFDLATALTDITAVLDALGWDRAVLAGHSWGGHLALHAAVTLADRCQGVLCLDPLGGVGDGGLAAFSAELMARTPEEGRRRCEQIDEEAGDTPSAEQGLEQLGILWPAYFADPQAVPPFHARMSVPANLGLFESLQALLPDLEDSMSSVTTPLGILMGGRSPMPVTAGSDVVDRVPGSWLEVVEGGGHCFWLERPGAVAPALGRLLSTP